MMTSAEYKIITARQDMFERKLAELFRMLGKGDTELRNLDLDMAIDVAAETGNHASIVETLKRQIEQEGRLKTKNVQAA